MNKWIKASKQLDATYCNQMKEKSIKMHEAAHEKRPNQLTETHHSYSDCTREDRQVNNWNRNIAINIMLGVSRNTNLLANWSSTICDHNPDTTLVCKFLSFLIYLHKGIHQKINNNNKRPSTAQNNKQKE